MRPLPERHPGISMRRIPLKGKVGLVFTVGVMVLFLIYLPQVRWFFALALPAGILVGVVLYLLHRR